MGEAEVVAEGEERGEEDMEGSSPEDVVGVGCVLKEELFVMLCRGSWGGAGVCKTGVVKLVLRIYALVYSEDGLLVRRWTNRGTCPCSACDPNPWFAERLSVFSGRFFWIWVILNVFSDLH